MADIVSLNTIRGQRTPDPLRSMVEEMEALLRLAKAGELKGSASERSRTTAARRFADFYGRMTAMIWSCSGLERICTSTSSAPPVNEFAPVAWASSLRLFREAAARATKPLWLVSHSL